ncbi:MAG: glutamate racemase [Halanaerobiales bacterium]
MQNKESSIALLDSGMGGLNVARELQLILPEEKIVYYGDTLHLPYGPRPFTEIRGYVYKIIDYLLKKYRVKIIGIACNTASTAVMKEVKKYYNIPIMGTIQPVVQRVAKLDNIKRVGIIGTEGTINSGRYQKILKANGLKVYSKACPLFVTMVEKGELAGPGITNIVEEYLSELKNINIEVLILACTHFPFLMPVISEFMGPEVELINSSVELAVCIATYLKVNNLINQNLDKEKMDIIVSDSSRVSKLSADNVFCEENIFVE